MSLSPTPASRPVMIELRDLSKQFQLHLQGGIHLPVFDGVSLTVHAGDCMVLAGESGSGKSSLMRMVYGNYRCSDGVVNIRHDGQMVDLAKAPPHIVLEIRRRTLGYVSQFLRVVPRVPTLEIVAEPLRAQGVDAGPAEQAAASLLERLRIPERLWRLPPATFSGGEQQRVNIARGFITDMPVMLLDEPTASLDAANRQTVIALILEARARGTALMGIFHDQEVREAVGSAAFDIAAAAKAA